MSETMTFEPATKRQLWALFCATKQDFRNSPMSKAEASKMLSELNENKPAAKITKSKAKEILDEAIKAGEAAADAAKPTPMIVQQHSDVLNDNSPVTQEWYCGEGVCGFAWINVYYKTPENRKFINELKKLGLAGDKPGSAFRKNYGSGYYFSVGYGFQSLERKIKYAYAFSKVLQKYNVENNVENRMD